MVPGLAVRRVLAVAGIAAALALAVPRVLTHTPYARLGAAFEWTERGARVSQVVGPPAQGLLKPGDILLTLDGQPFRRRPISAEVGRPSLPREPFVFGVQRGERRFDVTVPAARLSIWQRVRFLLLPLSALVAAPLVAFILVWRRPDLATAWVFFWFANMQAIGVVHGLYRYPEAEPTGAFRWFMAMYGWLVCWLPASLLHFMAVFPRPRWQAGGRWHSPWFWLVAASYLVPIYFVGQLVREGRLDEQGFQVFESTALGLGVVALVERFGRRGRPDWDPALGQRVLALLVATFLLGAAVLGWMLEDERALPLFQLPLLRLLVPVFGIGVLFVPPVIAYMIARDPVFDPRRLFEKTLPYAMLSGVVAALYLVIVLLGQRLFEAVTGEQAVVISLAATLAIAIIFAPLRVRLQHTLDRMFRRDPRVLRAALDHAGRSLLGALYPAEVRAAVESGLERGLGHPLAVDWDSPGAPRLEPGADLSDDVSAAVENLLGQARIRLENLGLQEQRAQAERREVELREAATRAELRALHAQVQPHFLFNALNALSYLTETDPAAAQRFTERLADMLRYTVEAGERPSALLGDEIGFVEDYLGVARERYEGTLTFRYRGGADLLAAPVPPLLLQPLVENSLKHGYSAERGGLTLSLDAERRNGWLTLTFADDGVRNGRGTPGLGVGLQNLEQRLRRFGGADASIEAGAGAEGGFTVRMQWRERLEAVR